MAAKRNLRTGFTTGTCAAAAAKGALLCACGSSPPAVRVTLPDGEEAAVPVCEARVSTGGFICDIVKDAGDDPDSTAGAVIRAEVKLIKKEGIYIKGGQGVGLVTRPGLAVPEGEPAINPVPRKMISSAVRQVVSANQGVEVTISVPDGERIARKTLNGRLGIIGGISILGTTGRVIPYSHAAYRESIVCALDVAQACGLDHVVFSTGKSSEQAARKVYPHLGEAGFVLMADYFGFAVCQAQKHAVKRITISCFPAKLLKMASGARSTHCSQSGIDLSLMAGLFKKAGSAPGLTDAVMNAHTVRHACSLAPFALVQKVCALLAASVCAHIRDITQGSIVPEVIVWSYTQDILFKGGY